MTDTAAPTAAPPRAVGATVRLLAVLVIVAGVVMLVAGAATWFTVQNQLADERITVSEDARWFAGEPIDGPLTAYAEAEVIEKHSLEASGGKTYAELDRQDPTRQTVMTGSFLRSSLFTSVVSFGVAALAMGLGLLLALIGYALLSLARQLNAVASKPSTAS
ncbi:aromatic ring-opening dioxygenase LigA [Micromonospora echinaurantiaca]|uniref:aromatic ring-opening dioxygenase LigA n=1 Tax=Micromonospora echinaurantiaca TaxID=47857 RepID=UPI00371109C0